MNEDLKQAYALLDTIYRRYIDMNQKYYPIVATWVITTLYQKESPTFPFLFLNAMKGSGKSRFLKLTARLVGGKYTTSLTNAVLFRNKDPLMLDEVENISSKEKNDLRELLNAAYKKGLVVMRAKKVEKSGETVIDEFEPYRPIALANINGLDDVLEDRCIKLTLEKSFNQEVTRKMEFFEYDPYIKKWDVLKNKLTLLGRLELDGSEVGVGSVGGESQKVYKDVLGLVVQYYNGVTLLPLIPTSSTHTTLPLLQTPNDTNDTLYSENEVIASLIYKKIEQTTLQGRDLELWYPLFITAALTDATLLDELITSAQEFAAERVKTNMNENNDVVLIGFLSSFLKDYKEGMYIPLTAVVNQFHLNDAKSDDWFNSAWLSRALDRNKLVIQKRRMRGGREVMFDFNKVAEKAKQFGVLDD